MLPAVVGQLRNTRFTPHSLAALANQDSERQTAPQNLQATGGIDLTMAHELLRIFDVGVQRRQRRLKYAQRLATKLESSMEIAGLVIEKGNATTCFAYVRMILRQHTTKKLKRLLLHHKSILVPPKCSVRHGKIAHCSA